MKTISQIILVIGILITVYGVTNAGLTYRDMRIQRLLHEPIQLMKIDLAYRSRWQSVSVPFYQTGNYVLYLRLPYHQSDTTSNSLPKQQQYFFKGNLRIDVEDDLGKIISQPRISGTLQGMVRSDHLLWVAIDTILINELPGSNWKIQVQVNDSDTSFNSQFADLTIIPPEAAEFLPYIEQEAPKLFLMGAFIILGFVTIVAGGYLNRRSARY